MRHIVEVNGTPDDNRKAALADATRTLESAANFTRGGGAPTPDHDATHASRESRIVTEQRLLIEWAKENGKLSASGRRPPVFAGGGEHNVFFQRRTRRFIKANRLDRHKGYGIALGSLTHGATPSEYLDRLALQNKIFHDDIRLERVVENDGSPIIITSQPSIKGHLPTQEALDELMLQKGYEKLAECAYYDEEAGLLIFDLFPRNAVQAADTNIYPIDPVIQRITPDFGQFLREQPYTINLR